MGLSARQAPVDPRHHPRQRTVRGLSGHDATAATWAPAALGDTDLALYREAAYAAVVADPFERLEAPWGAVWRYPWVHTWETSAAANADAAGVVTVSSDTVRPTVAVAAVDAAAGLVVGSAGHGRLALVEPTAALMIGGVVVGRAGRGLVEVRAGSLEAGEMLLADGPATIGRCRVENNEDVAPAPPDTATVEPGRGGSDDSDAGCVAGGGPLRVVPWTLCLLVLAARRRRYRSSTLQDAIGSSQ